MTLNGAIKQLHDIRNSDAMPVYFKPAIAEVINVLLYDVRENVRGEWIKPISRGDVLSYGKAYYECDQCHKVAFFGNEMNFCPNCGADMRERKEDGEIH